MPSSRLAVLASFALLLGCNGDSSGGPDGGADADAGPPPGCAVTAMGTSGLLIRGHLLLPTGPTDGELLIGSTGMITCAAASCSQAMGYASATTVQCTDAVISPALINPHDHTTYATAPPDMHGMIRYDHRNDWRTGAEGATPLVYKATTDDRLIAAQELRMLLGGTTGLVGSGGVHGLVRNLGTYPATFLEGLTEKPASFDTFPLGDENGTLITMGCAYPNITTASGAFNGGQYTPHIAEGVNLAAENELTCASLSSNDLVTGQTSVIHGVGLNAKDVAVIQAAGAKLIWSPRSNLSLYGDTAQVTEFRYAGVPIALGTDWLPSGSMNQLRELACADSFNQTYLNGTFSDQDLWEMATKNAAIASGFIMETGTLEVGKVADVAVFDATMNHDYRAVIAASVEDVRLVLRGGKVMYGDAALVSALQGGCTALSVCNIDRAVCMDVPGVGLSDIQAAIATAYPLFFCRGTIPDAEPSCVPYRSTFPMGVTSTDKDGDGVPDSSDDCPTIFNPLRPMDGTTQADVDGDGVGDACDAFPLDPTKH